eukprot:1361673-Amorphochlora_amoeboformis.AAC.1
MPTMFTDPIPTRAKRQPQPITSTTWRAMAIAILCSVTVSIGEDTRGTLSLMLRVKLVLNEKEGHNHKLALNEKE